MLQARSRTLSAALAVLALILAACGGGSDDGDNGDRAETTATPTSTPTPAGGDDGGEAGVKAPKGVSAARVNRARDRIVEVCQARTGKEDKPSEAESVADLREAAEVLEENFRANPDDEFRRRPGSPPASMRDRLLAAVLVLNTRCGDGQAMTVAKELLRATAEKDPKRKKAKRKKKPKATPTPTATPTPAATATPEGATG